MPNTIHTRTQYTRLVRLHIPTYGDTTYIPDTLECLENIKVCLIVLLMSWSQNYAVKVKEGG